MPVRAVRSMGTLPWLPSRMAATLTFGPQATVSARPSGGSAQVTFPQRPQRRQQPVHLLQLHRRDFPDLPSPCPPAGRRPGSLRTTGTPSGNPPTRSSPAPAPVPGPDPDDLAAFRAPAPPAAPAAMLPGRLRRAFAASDSFARGIEEFPPFIPARRTSCYAWPRPWGVRARLPRIRRIWGIHLTGPAQFRGLPWEGPIWAS